MYFISIASEFLKLLLFVNKASPKVKLSLAKLPPTIYFPSDVSVIDRIFSSLSPPKLLAHSTSPFTPYFIINASYPPLFINCFSPTIKLGLAKYPPTIYPPSAVPATGSIYSSPWIPIFSTSVALKKNDETIFGIVIDYNQNNVYYAFKGKGAYCNEEKIEVSDNDKLKDSILSFCLTSHYSNEHIKDVLNVEEKLAPKVRGLRLIVSAAIELCWCASGKIDGVINVKPSIGLSSAAGKLFVEEAGGKITNLKGEKRNRIDTLLVTNGKIHDELVKVLNTSK